MTSSQAQLSDNWKCTTCNGNKMIRRPRGAYYKPFVECQTCKGTGVILCPYKNLAEVKQFDGVAGASPTLTEYHYTDGTVIGLIS